MSDGSIKVEALMGSLQKIHEVSLIAFISIGMVVTGFALTILAPPLLSALETGAFSIRLSFFKASLDRHVDVAIMGVFLLVAGLTIFMQVVDESLQDSLSKLAELIPEFVTSVKLVQYMKLGITISAIGLVAMVIGAFNYFLTGLMLAFTGIALALSCTVGPGDSDYCKSVPFQMRLLIGGLLILLGIASFTTARVFPPTVLTMVTGVLLTMLSSIGFSILLAGLDKAFESPTLWVASLMSLTVALIPLSFLMLYLELPEIVAKIDRSYRG
ncbi:hypothetical protein IMZ38_02470 [Thermosphaera chiliense]|uniref:Uncharacterized protein n=1 Tax=Thermosphaera chiliense TaxID=3402707 RepID=A0A7M1UT62_9CREN|nr:hypothetical protein [Thermosphaera aggregans]QOR94807.1 hypothetical protein IMZ38_02470 [Thermosphaera aggregans]